MVTRGFLISGFSLFLISCSAQTPPEEPFEMQDEVKETKQVEEETVQEDATKNWVLYESKNGNISFKYPPSRFDENCNQQVPLQVIEKSGGLFLVDQTTSNDDCSSGELVTADGIDWRNPYQTGASYAIYLATIKNEQEAEQYVQNVLQAEKCKLQESNELISDVGDMGVESGEKMKVLFFSLDSQDTEEVMDSNCGFMRMVLIEQKQTLLMFEGKRSGPILCANQGCVLETPYEIQKTIRVR